MIFDFKHFKRMLESKRAHRERLAARPLGEQLRMLDTLRERELAIRGNLTRAEPTQRPIRSRKSRPRNCAPCLRS